MGLLWLSYPRFFNPGSALATQFAARYLQAGFSSFFFGEPAARNEDVWC